jgi:glycosyltransferase involved in cell wall biosynthesis
MRVVSILKYFREREYMVDMIHFEDPSIAVSYLTEHNLVRNLFLVSGNPFIGQKPKSRLKFFEKALRRNQNFTRSPASRQLPDWTTHSLSLKVIELLKKYEYDVILITYAYWASILKAIDGQYSSIRRIIDTNDFLTLQQFYAHKNAGTELVGSMFGDEIARLASFDDIIHISHDELRLFSNFIPGSRHHYIPQFFKRKKRQANAKRYDVLFIGSRNPYNHEGLNWFLEKIVPLLKKDIQIAIAGTICDKILLDSPNVSKLGFVPEVDELYEISKSTICPLLKGSGIKIKVIESLSYGLPVVSTSKGVDGFSNKVLDGGVLVGDDPQVFANFLNRLIADSTFYEEQSKCAFELFEKNFCEEINFKKLDALFEK